MMKRGRAFPYILISALTVVLCLVLCACGSGLKSNRQPEQEPVVAQLPEAAPAPVPEAVTAENISLDSDSLSLYAGDSDVTLTAQIVPVAAETLEISWASSDENIVCVTPDGTVTPVSPGTAEITASCGDVSAVCTVEVVSPVMTADVLACGDLVGHLALMYDAEKDEEHGFDYSRIFGTVNEKISAADYAFCTVECVFTGEPYMDFPRFHDPDGLAWSLKDIGYDMICCASNHSADGDYDGIVSTIDLYDEVGLDHIGTFKTQEAREYNRGILVKDINGVKIAFLDYTACTNGIYLYRQDFNYEWSVSNLFEGYYEPGPWGLLYDEFDKDLQAARDSGADFIITVMHWGAEYCNGAADYQKELTQYFFERGTDVIIGSHPHVLQPVESMEVTTLEGEKKTCYVCYSLGNLMSAMGNLGGDVTIFTDMVFEKNAVTGEKQISSFSFSPYYRTYISSNIDIGETRFCLEDMNSVLPAWESGTYEGYITSTIYSLMKEEYRRVIDICGDEFMVRYDR